MICLHVWARALRESIPIVVIVENVLRFRVALLRSLFEDLHAIDFIILDAKDCGSPAQRRRLYAVMTLWGKLILSRPLAEVSRFLREVLPERRSWELLFCLDGADDGFSTAVRKRAHEYSRVFCDRASAYDLDQLPLGRPRRAMAGCRMFGLTAHTRNVWSPSEGRCLRRSELAAAIGMPSHRALGAAYGMVPISFEHFSRSGAARLFGNGMSVSCVGTVMIWCAA